MQSSSLVRSWARRLSPVLLVLGVTAACSSQSASDSSSEDELSGSVYCNPGDTPNTHTSQGQPFCMRMIRAYGACDNTGCGPEWSVRCEDGRYAIEHDNGLAYLFCEREADGGVARPKPAPTNCVLWGSSACGYYHESTRPYGACTYRCDGGMLQMTTAYCTASETEPVCPAKL